MLMLISNRRRYYERNNYLIQQYIYIDRLLDSSLPYNLIEEYNQPSLPIDVPPTINEESHSSPVSPNLDETSGQIGNVAEVLSNRSNSKVKVKRTPKNLYKLPDEQTPLLTARSMARILLNRFCQNSSLRKKPIAETPL